MRTVGVAALGPRLRGARAAGGLRRDGMGRGVGEKKARAGRAVLGRGGLYARAGAVAGASCST